ncbi:hypothetical protein KP509_1Z269800 [Ceratopteris richardii]|nr:hypothetical protein KP509_1Z269800 [Ceratopteris richardii]
MLVPSLSFLSFSVVVFHSHCNGVPACLNTYTPAPLPPFFFFSFIFLCEKIVHSKVEVKKARERNKTCVTQKILIVVFEFDYSVSSDVIH